MDQLLQLQGHLRWRGMSMSQAVWCEAHNLLLFLIHTFSQQLRATIMSGIGKNRAGVYCRRSVRRAVAASFGDAGGAATVTTAAGELQAVPKSKPKRLDRTAKELLSAQAAVDAEEAADAAFEASSEKQRTHMAHRRAVRSSFLDGVKRLHHLKQVKLRGWKANNDVGQSKTVRFRPRTYIDPGKVCRVAQCNEALST